MTSQEAHAAVLLCLEEIAPGAGGDVLAPDVDFREALDLDSMDVFNLVAAIAERTGVEIPDRDVAGLTTLDALVAYLA